MTGRRRILSWSLGSVVVVLLALTVALSSCSVMRGVGYQIRHTTRAYFTEEGRFERIVQAASRAGEKGDFERSEKLYGRGRTMRPDSAAAAYGHAAALARLKRDDEALRTLGDAIRLGYDSAWYLEEDPAFRALRDRPEFAAIVETVRTAGEARQAALREASQIPPASSVRSFASLAEIERVHEDEEKAAKAASRGRPSSERAIEDERLESRRVATLERYVEEHPGAPDREDAALAAIRARVENAGYLWHPVPRENGGALVQRADAFLAEHAGSAHEAEVRFYRALAVMHGTLESAHAWDEDDRPRPDCEAALPELTALAAGDPADPWTGRALGYQTVCLFEREGGGTDAVREALARFLALSEPQGIGHVQDHRVRALVRALRFRMEGAPEFAARSVNARDVTLADFRGQVLLLDFWGPG